MAVSSQKFQAPKGTRDFYPQDMALRRYIESVWRQVSINHGFDARAYIDAFPFAYVGEIHLAGFAEDRDSAAVDQNRAGRVTADRNVVVQIIAKNR